jgi:hypothetical protein
MTRLEAVAWRVKDFADGWIIFQNENDANVYASSVGALIQALYVPITVPSEKADA